MAIPGSGNALSIGLLILRLAAGGMLIYGHGWGKLMHFAERSKTFSDPIGLGSPVSLGLAVFAEVFCAALVMLGFATRLASIPPAFLFAVAGFVHHAADPFQKKELAFLYLAVYLTLAFTGGGRFALDSNLGPKLSFRGGK